MVRIFSNIDVYQGKEINQKPDHFLSLKKEEIDGANLMHLIEYVIGFMKGNCKLDLHPSLKEKKSSSSKYVFLFFCYT